MTYYHATLSPKITVKAALLCGLIQGDEPKNFILNK